ncbi:hypothetical protein EDB86DRAFT_3088545 [Lactarius hatsudake]|nr:hypothetical protein EDB86DRAFT_3088545 [Lactarius hatsudake]
MPTPLILCLQPFHVPTASNTYTPEVDATSTYKQSIQKLGLNTTSLIRLLHHPPLPFPPSHASDDSDLDSESTDFGPGYELSENLLRENLDGRICDKNGNDIPPDTPPPPRNTDTGPDDWTPYENRLQFEVADFLFRRNQMSAGDINFLFNLWTASLTVHGDKPPFSDAKHMYKTIDSTPLGGVAWESFSLQYNGIQPGEIVLPWMQADYDVWFRDPHTLVNDLLSNPDFKSDFDYTPFQEYMTDGVHRFQDLMSENWAWKQANIIAQDRKTHGSVFCPIILGSDKTTVSVATGHNEYWPIYLSIGNIRNNVRRAHCNGVVLLGFFAIPKSTQELRDDTRFRKFRRQLLHSSLAMILKSLKAGMTTPEVTRFPDGHFRKVIYGLGPYIVDYPEQALLACTVQGWCPRCTSPADDLDATGHSCHSQAHTELLVKGFELGTLWDEYGLVGDIVPFTDSFPRADIHKLLAPDLLHQLIKGTFKDHLVTWVCDYIKAKHPKKEARRILTTLIGGTIALAPSFAGLRRFPEGRNFKQWTGDDLKALMKVYIPAIKGHVPDEMVQTMRAFLEFCYLARRNILDTHSLAALHDALKRFHRHREIFRTTDVRDDGFNLPRQHSLVHYVKLIRAFGAPNGLCSSITESKHIKAVKEPWRRSSRFGALSQMLLTNQRLDKLAAAWVDFTDRRMLQVTCLLAVWNQLLQPDQAHPDPLIDNGGNDGNDRDGEGVRVNSINEDDDVDGDGDVDGPTVQAHVYLAKKPLYRAYPEDIATKIELPTFPNLVRQFINDQQYPDYDSDASISDFPNFYGKIIVYPSAVATFYAPSDISGVGGMHRERIYAVKSWRKGPGRYDTIFFNADPSMEGMRGLDVARTQLFFSFTHEGVEYPCALVHWFSRVGDLPDERTGMWVVEPDHKSHVSIIRLDGIV